MKIKCSRLLSALEQKVFESLSRQINASDCNLSYQSIAKMRLSSLLRRILKPKLAKRRLTIKAIFVAKQNGASLNSCTTAFKEAKISAHTHAQVGKV